MDDLTCQELVELVTEYLEDALEPGERARFEAHLSGCVVCPRYVEQLRETTRLVGHLTERDLVAPVRDALMAAFGAWKHR